MIGIWWKPSLKWLSAKFRAVLAGLTAAPESRSLPGLSSPNDGSHHWSQTPLSRIRKRRLVTAGIRLGRRLVYQLNQGTYENQPRILSKNCPIWLRTEKE